MIALRGRAQVQEHGSALAGVKKYQLIFIRAGRADGVLSKGPGTARLGIVSDSRHPSVALPPSNLERFADALQLGEHHSLLMLPVRFPLTVSPSILDTWYPCQMVA